MSLAEPIAVSTLKNEIVARKTTKKVLLLGNDDRVVLAVLRGLGRNGVSVHVAWCNPKSPALKSCYVSQFHPIPPYDADSDLWLESLHRVLRGNDFDLVIPCNDFAVVPLQAERERLGRHDNWYLINDEAFRVAFDKGSTSQIAAELGINLPKEFSISPDRCRQISELDELDTIDGQPLRFPVYVKPRSSITQSDVAHKRPAQKIHSPSELATALRNASCNEFPAEGILIQEGFSGIGVGVEVLASEGKILMQIQHRRLRETIDGGSTYRETIAEIPDLSDATEKLVRRLDYTGVGMFEFRYAPDTGEWVFLEINARFWGSLPLAIAAGANFPFALYELIVNGRNDFDSEYRVGTRCRNLIQDFRAYRKQPGETFGIANLLLGRDHLDFFAADDWRPQIATLNEFVGSVIRKILRTAINWRHHVLIFLLMKV